MRSGERDENRPRTRHPLFDWLDNSARVVAAQIAGKQDVKTERDAGNVKETAPLEKAEVVIPVSP
jgi:hypothetical protein